MHAPYAAGRSGYLDKKSHHPGLLAAAVVLHIGVLGAILSYHPEILIDSEDPIELKDFRKIPKPPPPPKPDQPKRTRNADPVKPVDRPTTIVEPIEPTRELWPEQPPLPPSGEGTGRGPTTTMAEPPVAVPVLTAAGIDPRYARDLQPPYPAALERLEFEGSVTVRIQVGTDGRVTAVELVRADDPAFFTSTRDWALKRWRFKPATRDGVAISSWLTKTVQFRMLQNR